MSGDGSIVPALRAEIGGAPAAVIVDVTAPAGMRVERVIEAVAWAIDLAGSPARIVRSWATERVGHTLLDIGGVPVVVAESDGDVELIRVGTLGPVRVEISVCGEATVRQTAVRVSDAGGVRLLPTEWADPARRRGPGGAARGLAERLLATVSRPLDA